MRRLTIPSGTTGSTFIDVGCSEGSLRSARPRWLPSVGTPIEDPRRSSNRAVARLFRVLAVVLVAFGGIGSARDAQAITVTAPPSGNAAVTSSRGDNNGYES